MLINIHPYPLTLNFRNIFFLLFEKKNFKVRSCKKARFMCVNTRNKSWCLYTKVTFELSVFELLFSVFCFREHGLTWASDIHKKYLKKKTFYLIVWYFEYLSPTPAQNNTLECKLLVSYIPLCFCRPFCEQIKQYPVYGYKNLVFFFIFYFFSLITFIYFYYFIFSSISYRINNSSIRFRNRPFSWGVIKPIE